VSFERSFLKRFSTDVGLQQELFRMMRIERFVDQPLQGKTEKVLNFGGLSPL
jgi:hypothetical protein